MRLIAALLLALLAAPATAQDAPGTADHPAITRYPGSVLAWGTIENHMPYRIAVGPVTGYRQIDDWIETEGRVTRGYYRLTGTRTVSEVWRNYRDALAAAGFEILVEAIEPAKSTDPAGRAWTAVALAANPWGRGEPADEMVTGTSTAAGRGVVVARTERAEGTLYIVVHSYQFRDDQVSTLIDVIEEAAVETGLVTADAEAIGRDMLEYGRVVLDGILFAHDSADLDPASDPSLAEIARFLKTTEAAFHVVGHTDATGSFDYNMRLSRDRAASVVEALVTRHGIARARLEAHGVGPLNPVFTNARDAGRQQNRRVELVER